MKYCIFSDVHGNFLNLMEMFNSTADMKIDKYICLGDLCNYYSDNKKVIDFFIENGIESILGNHDQLYISKHDTNKERLISYNFDFELNNSNFHIDYLKSLPKSICIHEDAKILLCHGSPFDLTNEYIYPDSNLALFEDCEFDIVFCGHTHRQFLRSSGSKVFCNVGSVGMPRDNGCLLSFVVFDSKSANITLFRKLIDKEYIIGRYKNSVPKEVLEILNRDEPIKFPYTLLI